MDSVSSERMEHPPNTLHLLYHELRPGGSQYLYALDREEFDRHAEMFSQVRNEENPGLLPAVTFDDGHISDYECAMPILDSRGLIARFFITVGWTGSRPGYMGWPELKALHESGQRIGAHGWSHTLLTHCTEEELDQELRGARLLLEEKLGTAITTMSLPGGRFNRRVLEACREAGYTQVYTSVPKAEREGSGFLIGRLNIRGDMSMDWIRNVLRPETGALRRLERQDRMKAAAKAVLGDGLYGRLWGVLNRREPAGSDGEDYAG